MSKLTEQGKVEQDLRQKSLEILQAIHDYVQEKEGNKLSIEADLFGANTLTIFKNDTHSHVGLPDGSFELLIDQLHALLIENRGLSWV